MQQESIRKKVFIFQGEKQKTSRGRLTLPLNFIYKNMLCFLKVLGLFATKPVKFSKDQGQITEIPVLIQKKAVSTIKNDNWRNWEKNVTIE